MAGQGAGATTRGGSGIGRSVRCGGLKGGVWASSPSLNLSTEEQHAIIQGLADPSHLQANGVYVSGKKYLTLQANPRSIYGKAGGDGLCIVRTNQAVLIGVYNSPLLPGDANKVVEGLADYLISVGY